MENSIIEIVLVEDNPQDAELTIRAMRKYNLSNRLIHLKNGVEALDFFFARGEYAGKPLTVPPKIVLLDLKMPKVNGIEVLRELKNDPKLSTIPVVVLTSSNEDPDIRTCYELGVNSYIVKPVAFADFLSAVSELGLYWLLLNKPLTKF